MSEILRGKALSLTVSSNEWSGHIVNYSLESADKDAPTFAEAASGVGEYTLNLTVLQDLATGSAYRFLWDNAGDTGVAVRLAPQGNATATADKPHFTCNVTLPRTPTVGGTATQAATRFTTDVACIVETAVTLTTS